MNKQNERVGIRKKIDFVLLAIGSREKVLPSFSTLPIKKTTFFIQQ